MRACGEQHVGRFACRYAAHPHAGGAPRLHAKHGIFENQRGTRLTAELLSRCQEQVGRGLSALHLFGANDNGDTRC